MRIIMLRIAICDDETESRDALLLQLEKVLIEDTEEVVYDFSTGTGAVSWLQKHPGEIDLLFLDMEMPGLNGMETAKQIREFDEHLIIVFVTGYADYVFEGYRAGALDYLLKPVSAAKLIELIHRVREKMTSDKDNCFFLKNMDGTWRFHTKDILYFYSDKRKVTLVTGSGEYPFYARLDDVEKRLSMRFVRVHQRFLVNPDNVEHLGSDCVTLNGKKVPCSRKYREEAAAKIARHMIGYSL